MTRSPRAKRAVVVVLEPAPFSARLPGAPELDVVVRPVFVDEEVLSDGIVRELCYVDDVADSRIDVWVA